MLLQSIKNDIGQSLKRHETVRVGTLRFLLSAIRNLAIAKYGARGEEGVTDEDVLDTIKKQVKTRKESILAFTQAGRGELAQKEQQEMDILQAFLPKDLSDEELQAILRPIAASGETNFGLLMKLAMQAVAGRADGGRVSSTLKSLQK